MVLVKALVAYIEKNNVSLPEIAGRMDMEIEELKKMLYWDEDIYMSEFDDILGLLNITYQDLMTDVQPILMDSLNVDQTLGIIYDNLSDEEKTVVKQIMEVLENMDSVSKTTRRSAYIN